MPGRKGHVDSTKFADFLQVIPEGGVGAGYWRVKRERPPANGKGVLQDYLGWIEFKSGESYDELRDRIKAEFGVHKGPGVYYALPCDSEKKAIKNLDMARFEFDGKEIEMPEPPMNIADSMGLSDTMRTVKKVAQDAASLQQLDLQQKILSKYLGLGEDPKKKEEEVKETPQGGMNDMLMYRMLFEDQGKKNQTPQTDTMQQQILDAKLQGSMAEVKAMIASIQAQVQNQPKDGKFEILLEKLIEGQNANKGTSPFQEMMILMQKQTEERERQRQEDDRRRDETRQAEERRRDEIRRDEEKRREAERLHHEDERRAEERRREEERKEERRRLEDTSKGDREKTEKEMSEQRRRFDEELKIRREEMKQEQERVRSSSTDQQKQQMQMFELIRDNKNTGLELTSKIMDTMTNAGLSSMKTAQDAAETIMTVAKRAGGDKSEGGFGQILKDVGTFAAPLLASMGEDSRIRSMQMAQQQRFAKQRMVQRSGRPVMPQEQMRPANGTAQVPAANVNRETAVVSKEGLGEETNMKPEEGSGSMIAKYLQATPILKEALIGNLQDKLGAEAFMPVVTGMRQETLEGLLANLPHTIVMKYVKEVCNDEEKKLVDENETWFKEFRKHMIDFVKSVQQEEEPANK